MSLGLHQNLVGLRLNMHMASRADATRQNGNDSLAISCLQNSFVTLQNRTFHHARQLCTGGFQLLDVLLESCKGSRVGCSFLFAFVFELLDSPLIFRDTGFVFVNGLQEVDDFLFFLAVGAFEVFHLFLAREEFLLLGHIGELRFSVFGTLHFRL